MKNTKKLFIALMVIAAITTQAAYVSAQQVEQLRATAATFDTVFKSVRDKPGDYVINLSGNLVDYPGIDMHTAGVNITIKGTGSNRITWKDSPTAQSPLFFIGAGKLTLENINISRSSGNTLEGWNIIGVVGGTIEIKDKVTLSNNKGNQRFGGISVDKGSFIMSGGVIENCLNGLLVNGDGVSVSISGGAIRNNAGNGIVFWEASKNCTLNITGGTISDNSQNGVFFDGQNITININGGTIEKNACGIWGISNVASITISGGIIRNNSSHGIILCDKIRNCTLNISGGTISGNGIHGVSITQNTTFHMTGGEISGNKFVGVSLQGNNNNFTMSGGSIASNNMFGLFVKGTNIGFEKKNGAVIYGNSGNRRNTEGAIFVDCDNENSLWLGGDAASGAVYAAKTNAAGNNIVAGSKVGWN